MAAQIALIYLLIINVISFSTFAIDKLKAKKQRTRIPEMNLFILTAIGGSIGSILSMLLFHHKTSKTSFILKIILIVTLQLALYYLFTRQVILK